MLESASILKGLARGICDHLVEMTAPVDEDVECDNQNRPIHGVANYHVGAHIDSSSRKLTILHKFK
ncbi:MutS-like protein [Asimina triloba]